MVKQSWVFCSFKMTRCHWVWHRMRLDWIKGYCETLARASGVLVLFHFTRIIPSDEDISALIDGVTYRRQSAVQANCSLPPASENTSNTGRHRKSLLSLHCTSSHSSVTHPPSSSRSALQLPTQLFSSRLPSLTMHGLAPPSFLPSLPLTSVPLLSLPLPTGSCCSCNSELNHIRARTAHTCTRSHFVRSRCKCNAKECPDQQKVPKPITVMSSFGRLACVVAFARIYLCFSLRARSRLLGGHVRVNGALYDGRTVDYCPSVRGFHN